VKPNIVNKTPKILEQIAVLQKSEAALSSQLVQERKVFTCIIQEQAAGHEKQEAEILQLRRWLTVQQEIAIDKDHQIVELKKENEQLRQRVTELLAKLDERLNKEYQLRELQTMLYGQRSERFIPETSSIQTAIQQTLGSDFDLAEVEAIIQQAATPIKTDDTSKAILKSTRKRKRHQAHRGRRAIPSHIETETIVHDYPGDKTAMKPMGKKVSTYYDFVPGKLIKKIEEHLQYQSLDGEIIVCDLYCHG
jgi:transposase